MTRSKVQVQVGVSPLGGVGASRSVKSLSFRVTILSSNFVTFLGLKMSHPLLMETIWTDKSRADDAERIYHERLAGGVQPIQTKVQGDEPAAKTQPKQVAAKPSSTSSLIDEIARARQQIKNSLQSATNISTPSDDQLQSRVEALEKETKELRNVVQEMQKYLSNLQVIISSEKGSSGKSAAPKPVANGTIAKPKPATPTKTSKDNDDDDIDLFGSEEEEDQEAAKLREKRLEEYAAKKSKKTALIAKSSVILDVKPWDDETDMKELEKQVRSVEMDGLIWGASKLVPLAFGINKFQIVTVVEDDKVSIEELQEKIEGFEDLVQSVDIAAFNKL